MDPARESGVAAPPPAMSPGSRGRGTPSSRPGSPNPLSVAVTPFVRAGGYYAGAWRRYTLQRSRGDIPIVRPTVALAGHALVDELLLAGFRAVRSPAADAEVARIEAEANEAAALYEQRGWCDRPEGFLASPPPLEEITTRAVRPLGLAYERVSFESEYEPYAGEPGRDRWLGYAPNRRVRAWMLRHDEPKPWLIVVHGARMGRPELDLRLLRAQWLHEDLGLNVVLPVLPLHGPRRRGLPRDADFPGEDVLDNVHGAAQAVWDIRRLVSWIRAQDPTARIGMTGISLGGYVVSLVAGVEDGLSCAIVGVPAVDLVDLIEYHGGAALDDEHRRIVTVAKRLSRVVSPLALPPRVPHEGRFVYAGLADRLVHPRHQVVRLWEHWGRPEIIWYPGSHIGFMRSKPVGRFVRAALVRSGLVESR
jgi:X-Pro dipeptidyl-peptidase (S15 family)